MKIKMANNMDTKIKITGDSSGAVNAIKKVEKQADSSNKKMSKSSTALTKMWSGGWGYVGAKIANTLVEITGKVVDFGKESVKIFREYEYQMAKVKAVTQTAGAEFDKIDSKVRQLGNTTQFTSKQMAEASYYMGLAGWDSDQIVAGLPAITTLATATGEDLAKSSDLVTDYLTAFGMGAEEATRFVDVLAQTSVNSNTTVAQLGQAFKYSASMASEMGIKVEDLSLYLGIMANSGVKGTRAGSTLRNVFSRLSGTTEVANETMKELGVNAFDSKGNFKGLNTVIDDLREAFSKLSDEDTLKFSERLATKQGQAGLLSILSTSQEELDGLKKKIEEADGASAKMAMTMEETSQGIDFKFNSAIEGLQLKLGQDLTPTVDSVKKSMTEWFNNITGNGVKALTEFTKESGIFTDENLLLYDKFRSDAETTFRDFYSGLIQGVSTPDGLQGVLDAEDKLLEQSVKTLEGRLLAKETAFQEYYGFLTTVAGLSPEEIAQLDKGASDDGVKKIKEQRDLSEKKKILIQELPTLMDDPEKYRETAKEIELISKQQNKIILDGYINTAKTWSRYSDAQRKAHKETMVNEAKAMMKENKRVYDEDTYNATNSYVSMMDVYEQAHKRGELSQERLSQLQNETTTEYSKKLGEIVLKHSEVSSSIQSSLGEAGKGLDIFAGKEKTLWGSLERENAQTAYEKATDAIMELMYAGTGFEGLTADQLEWAESFKKSVADQIFEIYGVRVEVRNLTDDMQNIPKTLETDYYFNKYETTMKTEIYKIERAHAPYQYYPHAKGGIFNGEVTLGNHKFGEAGKEAIVPLTNPNTMQPFAKAIADNMGGAGDVVNINVAKMEVRNDSDINKIAKELEALRNRNKMQRR